MTGSADKASVLARAFAVSLLLVLPTACSHSEPREKETNVTESTSPLTFLEARSRAQQAARAAATALASGATLQEYDEGGGVTYCADRSDPPKGTPVNWASSYQVMGVEPDPALIDSWVTSMGQQGWTRRYGDREKGNVALGNADDLTVVLIVTANKVSLLASTPCVKPPDPDHPLANPSSNSSAAG